MKNHKEQQYITVTLLLKHCDIKYSEHLPRNVRYMNWTEWERNWFAASDIEELYDKRKMSLVSFLCNIGFN